MIGIATGRTRTLTVTGNISGTTAYSGEYFDVPPPDPGPEYLLDFNLAASLLGNLAGFTIEGLSTFDPAGPNDIGYSVAWTMFCGDQTDTALITSGAIGFDEDAYTVGGSYSLTLQVAEAFDQLGFSFLDPSYLDDGYPKWDDLGLGTVRGCPATSIHFFEVLEAGTEVTFTISGTGVTSTLTYTVPDDIVIDYGHSLQVESSGGSEHGGVIPSNAVGITLSQIDVEGYDWDFSYAADGVSNSANSDSGIALFTSGQLTVGVDGGRNYGTASRVFRPKTKYRWNLNNFRYDQAHDQVITWQLYEGAGLALTDLNVTGNAEREFIQYQESISADLSGSDGIFTATDSFSIDTIAPVNARIKQSSLSAIGEDPANWRPFIHGKGYPVFSVSQDETLEVTGTSTTGWTGGTNTTVSSGLTLTTNSSGAGSATRAWSGDGLNVEGYRWLKVRIRSVGSANQPVTLAIGSKTWSLTTSSDGTWVERFVDLCCPGNSSWTTDDESSRYPITHDTRVPIAESPDSWGVKRITSLSLTGLPVSSTIEVSKIEQIRRSGAHASFIPFFAPETLRWTSPSDDTYGWTGIYLNTDGRNNDLPDQYHVVPFVGEPYYVHYTISQMMTLIEEISGWNTTISGSFPDDFHDEDLFGYFLEGAGYYATYSGSGVTWATRGHYSIASATINAQPLWDWVKVYPGAGDVWSGSSVGATPLAVHWSGRGRATGIVFDIDKSPKSGAVVSTDPSSGSGTTDSYGQYLTSTPFFKHDVSTDVKVGSQEITTVLESGQVGRFCFIVESNGTSVWAHNLLSVFGFAHWVWATNDGVKHRRSNTSWPLVVDVNSVVSSDGSDACPVLRQNADGRLFCLFVRGALGSRELFECYSDDDGATWTTPEEIGLAEYCYTFTDSFGYEGRAKFVFDSGSSGPGKISVQTRGPGESAFGSWVQVAVSGSPVLFAEGSFGIVAAEDAAGHWILTAVNDGDSEPTNYASTDEAVTWKLA